MRYFYLLLFFVLVASLSAQTNHAVGVSSNVFTPDNLTIAVGDTVTWTNNGGFHNVNGSTATYPSNPAGFDNGNAASNAWTYDFVFTQPGTYDYQCDPHAGFGMVAQIVVEAATAADTLLITEIMYNPPEGGTDSLEFIEVYNPSTAAVNMTGWTVSQGVVLEFPLYILAPGEFLILAGNEAAFRNVFDYTGDVFEWTSGGLSNGGETIALSNSSGTVIVAVEFDDRAPWPEGTDGQGASLVFCDITADITDAANWQAASNVTGVVIDDKALLADPGALSDCGLDAPALKWITQDLTVSEGDGTVTISVEARNMQGLQFEVRLSGGTTTDAGDLTTDPVLPATYTVGDQAIETLTIDIVLTDDALEEIEEALGLTLQVTAPAEITGSGELTITILDNDQAVSPIASVNALDANGVAISAGRTVALQGVVHCIDFRDNDGIQFWIIEPNGDGINVFNFNDVSDYQVNEGDEILVTGELVQFRGLLEIVPDAIELVSSGNDLVAPTRVDKLEESLENRYVTLNIDRAIENGIERAGGGFNVTVVQRDLDTTVVRVEDETGIDSTFLANYFFGDQAPESSLVVSGLVSQRDFSAPFDEFYQLFPCGESSFDLVTGTREPEWAQEVLVYPNPTGGVLELLLPTEVNSYRLMDLNGRILQQGQPSTSLDLTELPAGMYQLQFIGGNGFISRTVIKQ
ncbi:MAG: plastocyanin/DNA/RNA endonuclease YhcR with UshA esterase domain [Neolewinella sp.]|jgi:plastocyanin/DNA/RNA endonuclease YhcR with UshA esterase domain